MIEPNQIICGHILDVLRTLPDNSMNCCVTSPPYWGLRDYGTEPQIWDAVDRCEHEWNSDNRVVERFVGQGSGWLIGHEKGNKEAKMITRKDNPEYWEKVNINSAFCIHCNAWLGSLGLEPTIQFYISHLIQIFDEIYRVLRKDGTCFVNMGDTYAGGGQGDSEFGGRKGVSETKSYAGRRRNNEVANKSLCQIPSRFAIAMTDNNWILRNEINWWKRNCMPSSAKDRFTVDFERIYFFTKNKKYWFEQQFEDIAYSTQNDARLNKAGYETPRPERSYTGPPQQGSGLIQPTLDDQRNMRTTWDINIEAFSEAHFAVFPPKLVRRMLDAGCPEGGIVLDPFMGSGTTALVAKKTGKNYIGIELSEEYIKIAEKRLYDNNYELEL